MIQKSKKMKKTILIDLDDTLGTLLECWLELYNKKYDDNLQPQNILSWGITDFIKPEAVDDMYELLKTPELFSEMIQPKEDSVEATDILSKFYNIYIVTACVYPQNIVEKFKWIERFFPHISTDNIITAKNKSLIVGDYIIDDYLENLVTSKCDKKLLFFAPHNVFAEITNESITRINNWEYVIWYFAGENEELREYVFEKTTEDAFSKQKNLIKKLFSK